MSDRAAEIALKHCEGKHPKTWLFLNPKGRTGNYNQRSIAKLWRRYSGTTITRYEATRHSFASQPIEHNDVVMAKELMRHPDMRSTEKYLHIRTTRLREAVNTRKNVISLTDRSKIEANNEGYEFNNNNS